jgi:plastocyanin
VSASPGAAVSASPSAAAAAAATIQMTDALKFDPATVTVPRGSTVMWRNTSQVQHTVTDDPSKAATAADAQLPSGVQAWDSGLLDPGATFSHTFDVPGTYKYFCQPHEAAGMMGTIVVQ